MHRADAHNRRLGKLRVLVMFVALCDLANSEMSLGRRLEARPIDALDTERAKLPKLPKRPDGLPSLDLLRLSSCMPR